MFANAEAYERFMGRWSRLVAPPLLDFARLSDHGPLLDVGSGTGALTSTLAQRYPAARIVGIDPSKEYIGYATDKNPRSSRVSFEQGHAQRLRFEDETFEGAVSLLVLNFVPKSDEALLELRRVTIPGGEISAAVWDYGAGMRMLRTFWDAAVTVDPDAEKLDERHMPLCRAGELAALWTHAGLQNVEENTIDIEMKFESFADYWEPFLLGQGPAGSYAHSLAPAQLDDLRHEVLNSLGLPAESSAFFLPARAWAVRGVVPSR